MRANDHIPPIMHIPSPLWFASASFAGWGLQFLVLLAIHAPAFAGIVHAIGFAVLACAGCSGCPV